MAGPSRRVAGRRRSGDEPEPTTPAATPPIVPARRRPSPAARPAEPVDLTKSDEATAEEAVEDVAVEDVAVDEVAVEEPAVDEVPSEEAAVEEPPAAEDAPAEPEAEHHPSPGPLIKPSPKPSTRSPLMAPLVVGAVALVALVASVLWLVHLDGRAPLKGAKSATGHLSSISDAGVYTPGSISNTVGAQAVQAAVTALPVVLSYDYRALAKGIADAKVYLTPGYSKIFEQTYETTVSKFATANKTVTKALVRSAGLVNADKDSATVLVFLDEALVTADGSQPKVNLDRVKLTMLRSSNGKWLIDALQPF